MKGFSSYNYEAQSIMCIEFFNALGSIERLKIATTLEFTTFYFNQKTF